MKSILTALQLGILSSRCIRANTIQLYGVSNILCENGLCECVSVLAPFGYAGVVCGTESGQWKMIESTTEGNWIKKKKITSQIDWPRRKEP